MRGGKKRRKVYSHVIGGSVASGENIVIYTGDLVGQRFKIHNNTNGYYIFLTKVIMLAAIDLLNGTNQDNQNIRIYLVNNKDAQSWKLIK